MTTSRLALVCSMILALGFPSMPGAAEAQGKVVRIGLLDYGAANPSSDARWRAFRERLRELGYVEGQNVVFEPGGRTDGEIDCRASPPSSSISRSTSW